MERRAKESEHLGRRPSPAPQRAKRTPGVGIRARCPFSGSRLRRCGAESRGRGGEGGRTPRLGGWAREDVWT